MSFRATDAGDAYKALLLEAIELSDRIAQRLEELYRKYPSPSLEKTLEELHGVRDRLTAPENQRNQDCAHLCSREAPVLGSFGDR